MGRFSHILLAADFDRTLTDRQSAIPQANLDAILAFEREGGAFTVATGRSVPMFRARDRLIPSNAPLVLYNGAALYDYGTETMTDAVPLPCGRELLRDMTERFPELWLELQGVDCHYLIGDCPMRAAFYRSNDAAARQATIDELPEQMLKIAMFGTFYDETVRQFFSATPEEQALFDRAIAYLERRYGDVLTIDRAATRIIDVQAKSVSKGAAVRRLAERMGRSLVICAGDAPNDVSMLEAADLAFVPSDCEPSLLNRGYRVACSCDEGTIAGLLRSLNTMF